MNRLRWQGVIIKESLNNQSVFGEVKIVGTKEAQLESEGERGMFHFLSVEVEDNKLENVLEKLKKSLRPSWYVHLVKGNVLHVAFLGKVMTAHTDNASEFESIRIHALSKGIHADQLPLEHLLAHPFD
ncbi:hypothetical protein A2875_02830 [Candidatus Gottesmanbacteria bacterium RIFCSPHIGHO2_01_FULL_46_14]|uniref:Uncharacterized protein n=4 Tax=Microgenomates group TaxID=1794810 RepID=A0A1F5ZPP1_9BACT|nr:MAG: hypothetical protein UU34_C0005G0016 [Candidatus Curtissbacteria bacterium GW2011_GWA1_41_11]KKS12398.1 MAG: hypothetical protein UU67_C0054G0008 [Candidatus Daviesbacteria bacterium GW2011_GWB1_41_5]OGG14439.1 MAG: hypothetical protein A2875_02830 [Candidatus Gottesmanbacteria bacterium RIFCSPHIGHO2_01_FULL_46_14]OGG28544.1 MAG: hypothetical protein A2971_03605 [Candidatus Gottesmanbacteria bacterium RIFCSPLOWO2_01_FULL_46_21]